MRLSTLDRAICNAKAHAFDLAVLSVDNLEVLTVIFHYDNDNSIGLEVIFKGELSVMLGGEETNSFLIGWVELHVVKGARIRTDL